MTAKPNRTLLHCLRPPTRSNAVAQMAHQQPRAIAVPARSFALGFGPPQTFIAPTLPINQKSSHATVGIDGRLRLKPRATPPRWSGQIERREGAHPAAKRPPRRSSCVAAPFVSGHRGPAGERHRVSQADGVCGIMSRNPTCDIPPVQ